MKYKYSGRVFNIKEFKFLDFDIAMTAKGTISGGMLKTDEWVYVTPYGNQWAEIIDDSEVEDSPVVGVDIPHPGHPVITRKFQPGRRGGLPTESEMTPIYKDDASALFRCLECDFEWRICEVKGCKLQAFREVWIKVRASLGIPTDLKRVRFVCLDHYAELHIDNGE